MLCVARLGGSLGWKPGQCNAAASGQYSGGVLAGEPWQQPCGGPEEDSFNALWKTAANLTYGLIE